MKKIYLATVISSALLLSACGGEVEQSGDATLPVFESYISESLAQPTKLQFTLQGINATVPVPNNLLFNSVDATLEIPTGGDDALSNPLAAMGQMDGWSTTSQLVVPFGAALTSSPAPNAVTLIKLSDKMTGNPLPEKLLTYGVDYVTATQGNNLIVVPLADFDPASEYIIAVTDSLLDETDQKVGMSQSYATLKSKSRIYESGDLASAQSLTHGIEQLVQAGTAGAVNPNSIVYSAWFTTQSVGATLYATKAMYAQTQDPAYSYNGIWQGTANPNNVDLSQVGHMNFGVTQDYALAVAEDSNFTKYFVTEEQRDQLIGLYNFEQPGTVNVTKGSIKLPYYLDTGENWNTQPFESGSTSLAIINHIIQDEAEKSNFVTQLVSKGIDPTKFETDPASVLPDMMGHTFTKLDGSRYDEERIVTQYAPVPAVKSLQDVNFLLFTPSAGAINGIVIYQHGITSAKENTYLFANNMVNAGLALIAIDAPIHGDRSLDEQRSANADILAYMNLAVLPVARDNIRQSMLDLIGLRLALTTNQLALTFAGTPLENLASTITNPPGFLGHSLGGVLGVPAVTQANAPVSDTADVLFKFKNAAFINAGGQAANLLFGSGAYGPLISHNIAQSAGIGYDQFATVANCGEPDSDDYEKNCLLAFEAQNIPENYQNILGTNLQFIYAAQTVLDTADPYTHATTLKALGTPVYMAQVLNDDTVPNNVPGSPDGISGTRYVTQSLFAGTEPLAAKLGLTLVDSSYAGAGESNPFVRFNSVAQHSTFVAVQDTTTMSDLPHHAEMQSEVASFFATGTSSISNASNVLE
ncbi:VolA/Pla-1 family phospholipase [Vibrio mediterranei]|uniref:VolA/Pla-1 family phospholipase n=1 Tax=Vibrio mediterranei TaxID=689 RepID=UPI00406985F9